MLRSLKSIEGYRLQASDGDLGKTKDFYFDDESWTVRYAIVDTHKWLPGRLVLISPSSFDESDWDSSVISTPLTKEQVREAPSVEKELPVSRQNEAALATHFAWPTYWIAPTGGAVFAEATAQSQTAIRSKAKQSSKAQGDPNLRSLNEIVDYKVLALDESQVGLVSDLIVETDNWNLRYLVADTNTWLPGGKVLLSPEWIESVQWDDRAVRVDLTEDMIKACPPYKPTHAVNREYEERIYDYYGRPRYWA